MTDAPKHISQLDPTRRARAQQSIQEALLVIVEGAEDADGNRGIMLAVEKAGMVIDPTVN